MIRKLSDEEDSQASQIEKRAIAARFCAECVRLEWGTQLAIANRLTVSHRTISAIFSSHRVPSPLVLAHASRVGMDVQFVLTGEYAQPGVVAGVRVLEQRIVMLESALAGVSAIASQAVPALRKGRPMAEEPVLPISLEQRQLLAQYAQQPESTQRIIRTILGQGGATAQSASPKAENG